MTSIRIKKSDEYKKGRNCLDLYLNTNVIELISLSEGNFRLCLEIDTEYMEVAVKDNEENRYLSESEMKELSALNSDIFYKDKYSMEKGLSYAYHLYKKDEKSGLFIEEDLGTEFFYELEDLDTEIEFMMELFKKEVYS